MLFRRSTHINHVRNVQSSTPTAMIMLQWNIYRKVPCHSPHKISLSQSTQNFPTTVHTKGSLPQSTQKSVCLEFDFFNYQKIERQLRCKSLVREQNGKHLAFMIFPADPTFPFNGVLGFCCLGAQWSNGSQYTIRFVCPIEQWGLVKMWQVGSELML